MAKINNVLCKVEGTKIKLKNFKLERKDLTFLKSPFHFSFSFIKLAMPQGLKAQILETSRVFFMLIQRFKQTTSRQELLKDRGP